MAVKVYSTDGSNENHPDGRFIYVHDGALFVAKSGTMEIPDTVAVYAKGRWLDARVEKD